MDLKNGHLEDKYHARMILLLLFTMKCFCIFFRNFFFFFFLTFWHKKIRRHSERCSVISGVLLGLVKICKKYMEVNPFLLVS